MTGGICAVVFMGASLEVSQAWQRVLFVVMAAMSVLVAAYDVWRAERAARCEAEARVDRLTSTPSVTQRVYLANPNVALSRAVAVSVVNVGQITFAVSAAEVTVSDHRPLQEQMNVSVPVGGAVNVFLPTFWRDFRIDFVPTIDFQVRLQIKWLDREEWLEPSVFHAQLDASPNGLRDIGSGYVTQRRFGCPRCNGQLIPLWMDVSGTRSEAGFQERKGKYLEELRASCPQHYSQYALKLPDGDWEPLGAYPGQ